MEASMDAWLCADDGWGVPGIGVAGGPPAARVYHNICVFSFTSMEVHLLSWK